MIIPLQNLATLASLNIFPSSPLPTLRKTTMIKALLPLTILLLTHTKTNALVLKEDPNCTHDAKNFRCVKYLNNYDGDTITVDIPRVHPLLGKKISVRVAGVDTPEIKSENSCEKKKAKLAKKFTAELLKKSYRIDLKNVRRDKYFRIVADVIFDGKSLSKYLLKTKDKLAVPYDGGTKTKINWCKKPPPPQKKAKF